jgi:hypothetical protein
MRHNTHLLSTLLLLGSAVTLAACDSDTNSLEDSPEAQADAVPDDDDLSAIVDIGGDFEAQPESATAVEETPDFVLELDGGSTLSFLLGDDGGVAMLEDVPVGARVASALDDPALRDASPAVVWYALTTDGIEIPEGLRAHHEGLAAIGELAPLADALAQQPRDITRAPRASESPCLNATFNINHCANPEYDDEVCWFNVNGSLTWVVPNAKRYKAGFCLQTGSARSWLSYYSVWPDPSLGCVTNWADTFAWGGDSYWNGTAYNAETYRSYVYWAGSNGVVRKYTLHADGDPGAVWDLGARYSMDQCG